MNFSRLRSLVYDENMDESVGIFTAIGIITLASYVYESLKSPKTTDKQKVDIQKTYSEKKKDPDAFIDACKTGYNIELTEKPSGLYKTEKDLINNIESDMKSWLTAIKSSKQCKDAVVAFIIATDEDSIAAKQMIEEDEIGKKLTASYMISCILSTPKKNGSGNMEYYYIDTNKAGQNITGELYWVAKDLIQMLNITYSNYISNVSAGDGDEGIISFEVKG